MIVFEIIGKQIQFQDRYSKAKAEKNSKNIEMNNHLEK